jgi:hypothetical protein
MNMKIAHSGIVTAFSDRPIGTKVSSLKVGKLGGRLYTIQEFNKALLKKLESYSFPENGQGVIQFDEYLSNGNVSCGVARRVNSEGIPLREHAYYVREYRGEMGMFALRSYAAHPEHLFAIVYTLHAYAVDAQVSHEELVRVKTELGASLLIPAEPDAKLYVLVALLATVGPKPTISSHRFVRNLAGGNFRYSQEEGYTLEKAIEEAKAIEAYEREWITVADE